jgi:L-threonylcarbamoyladenylate synthase
MSILPATGAAIAFAAKMLKEGHLVAFPTETVYGLGADVFNPDALASVFEVKHRPRFDPLIVHIAHKNALNALVDFTAMSALAKQRLELLSATFWPGPLTLILPKQPRVPGLATAGLATVAVRFPDNPVALRLISGLGADGAVAAPSANPFGYLSPTCAEHVAAQLGNAVPVILDDGPCKIGVESTVLDISESSGDAPRILRPGGITVEALRAVLPDVREDEHAEEPHRAPGQLASHYAPRTPLYLHSTEEMRTFTEKPGDVCLRLDETLQKSAASLFEKLHLLDGQGYAAIHAELAPEHGLGIAINDRLRRAAAR